MRKLIRLVSVVLLPFVGWAQDRIVSKEGVEISCKITSYTAQLVRYTNGSNDVSDSIATEKVRVLVIENTRKITIVPKSYQYQLETPDEAEFRKMLQNNEYGTILRAKTILQKVSFFTGRFILTSEARQQLSTLAVLLKSKKVGQIEMLVHTDTAGRAIKNLELSEKRALSIKDFLVSQGLNAEQIKAEGRGEAEPIFGGADRQTLNRRVELRVLSIEGVEILYSEKYIPPVIVQEAPAAIVVQTEKPETDIPIQKPKIRKSAGIGLSTKSDVFNDRSNFFWFDYQLVTNRGKRPDLIKSVVPPVGFHYERHLWKVLGFRAELSSQWWEETKVLAESSTRTYSQLFKYQYWIAGAGPTLHFSLSPKWDTYVGLLVSFRWVRASCDCYTLNETTLSGDPFLGTRYFLGNRLFITGEAGRHGTSYIKLGAGLKL